MNFKIPDTSSIPNYIPTPPTAKIDQISIRGKALINFSEDMFRIPDIDN